MKIFLHCTTGLYEYIPAMDSDTHPSYIVRRKLSPKWAIRKGENKCHMYRYPRI